MMKKQLLIALFGLVCVGLNAQESDAGSTQPDNKEVAGGTDASGEKDIEGTDNGNGSENNAE